MPKGKKRPVNWNGVQYPSIQAAADACGIKLTSMRQRIENGYTCDEDVPGYGDWQAQQVTWNGVQYRSISAAARANGVSTNMMWRRVRAGYTCDKDVPPSRIRPVMWDGVQYPSIRAAAEACGVTTSTMHKRIVKHGYTRTDQVPRSGQWRRTAITWNGVQYRTIAIAARATGHKAKDLRLWQKMGYSKDADLKRRR